MPLTYKAISDILQKTLTDLTIEPFGVVAVVRDGCRIRSKQIVVVVDVVGAVKYCESAAHR